MSIEYFVLGILTVLMIAQNIFWAKVVLNLTNRLMSRNYVELKQAEQKPAQHQPSKVAVDHDPIAERQATELNSLLGMA